MWKLSTNKIDVFSYFHPGEEGSGLPVYLGEMVFLILAFTVTVSSEYSIVLIEASAESREMISEDALPVTSISS